MIHYHGTPITPKSELMALSGRHFCVSHARPDNLSLCLQIGQSLMFDNGAFSAWTRGETPDWKGYYAWLEPLLGHPHWAVIPDVIDGDEQANDDLIQQWPHGNLGAPVWHMHESIGRFLRLAADWPRVCIGSSGVYRDVGSRHWHARMVDAMNVLGEGKPGVWLHGLRMMSMAGGPYPLASADSTDVGRNHSRPQNTASKLVARWDRVQTPLAWTARPVQLEMA